MKALTNSILVTVALVFNALGAEAKPQCARQISILIIDGQNNHNWRAMTPYMKAQLKKTGMFKVAVSTTPQRTRVPGNLSKEKRAAAIKAANELNAKRWEDWRPAFLL